MTSEAHNSRKTETLYALSRDEYAAAERRFDDAEGKIARYLAILFIVLGIATLSVDTLKTAMSIESGASVAFVTLAGLSYVCGLLAFGYFVSALAIQQVKGLKLDESVSKYFSNYTMEAGLQGLSSAYFKAAALYRQQTQAKLQRGYCGFRLLIGAAIFAVLAAGSFFFVEPLEATMTSIGPGGNNGNGDEQSSSSQEPSDDVAQAAQEAEQLFEEMQKGLEGGDDTEKR